MSHLVLVRHGESRWNLSNRFTGWVDVPLSARGIKEAEKCARQLKKFNFDVAFTSKLTRAQSTLIVILSKQHRTGVFQHPGEKPYYKWTCESNRCSKDDIPVYTSEMLNERYYGELQGMMKDDAEKKFGKKELFRLRRGFKARPPNGESLADAYKRMLPYFQNGVEEELRKKNNVLLASHGNTLRAIMKYIDGISDEDIPFLDLPEGKPIIYSFERKKYTCLNPNVYSFERPLR